MIIDTRKRMRTVPVTAAETVGAVGVTMLKAIRAPYLKTIRKAAHFAAEYRNQA